MTGLKTVTPEKEWDDLKEMISTLLILPEADKTLILSNVRILKSLREIEKANGMKGA